MVFFHKGRLENLFSIEDILESRRSVNSPPGLPINGFRWKTSEMSLIWKAYLTGIPSMENLQNTLYFREYLSKSLLHLRTLEGLLLMEDLKIGSFQKAFPPYPIPFLHGSLIKMLKLFSFYTVYGTNKPDPFLKLALVLSIVEKILTLWQKLHAEDSVNQSPKEVIPQRVQSSLNLGIFIYHQDR